MNLRFSKSFLLLFSLTILISCNIVNLNATTKITNGISFDEFKKNRYSDFLNKMKYKDSSSVKVNSIYINDKLLENNFNINSLQYNIRKRYLLSNKTTTINQNIKFIESFDLYNGDIISNNVKLSGFKINDGGKILFESDVLIIRFNNYQGLEKLKKLYDAKIVDKSNDLYKLKVNLDKAPINNLEKIIESINTKIPYNISNIEFSSLASMKLFAIAIDFLLNNKDDLNSFELNFYVDTATPNIEVNDWSHISPAISKSDNKEIKSWWLNSPTNILSHDTNDPNNLIKPETWKYSIGTNQKVAVVDSGFNLSNEEYKRRLIVRDDSEDTNLKTDNNSGFHGSKMSMIIAGERNNDLGSVGVAPNSFIIPYNFGYDTFKTEKAIRNIIKNKDDIINMSNSVQIDFWVYIVAYINGISSVENAIKDSISSNIPVIVAGNNNGSYSDKFGYANLTAVSGVIAVGGVDIIPRNNDGTLVLSKYPDYTATFIKNKSYSENGKGSGFGDDYVWAPWQYYSVLDVDNNKNVLLIKEGGTSGAAAFTSGVVALMKSRNKNLTPSDIEDILHKTSDQLVKPHEDMTKFGDQKLINAKKAVEEAIERKIKDDKKFSLFDYEAKDLGIVQFNLTKTLSNVKENNNIIGTIKFNDDTSQDVLRTASDYELDNSNNNYVRFFGWEPNITGLKDGLEVLNMKKEIIPDPYISSIELNSSQKNTIKNGTEIKINGSNLYSFDKDIQIIFKDTTVTPKVDYYYNLSPNSVTRNKNATLLFFTVDFNKIKNSSGQSIQDKLNGFSSIKVDVAFKGISNKISNFVKADASNSFFISSLPSTISYNNQQIPVIENVSTTQVHKGDTIAIAINPAWRDIEWVVDSSKSVKLSQIVDKYAITKVPPDLPEYFQSVLMQFVLSGTKQYVSYEKALEILAYPETLSYQGSNIPVVANGTNTMVISGSKIAVPLPSDVIERLQNKAFYSDDKRYTYYDVVNEYAILGVPPNLSSGIKNIILKDLSTGDTVLTFEQALHKAALAMNLNPVTPADAINLPNSNEYPPFIYDKTSMDTHIGDIVAAALYGLSQNDNVSVTVNGQDMPIYDKKDGYLSFKIQGNLSGINSVNINVNNESITYRDALNILGGVSNNQKIAFIENSMLYTMDPDGSNIKSIAPASDLFLSWSPDKSKIAYTSNEAFTLSYVGGPVLLSKVVVTDSDGNSKIKVSKGGINTRDSYPVWSYDGTKIAFFRHDLIADKSYLCTVDFNDSSENILLEISKYTTALSWSRDNSKISYVVQNPNTLIQELHVFDGTTDRKLFDNVGVSEWTLDNKIVYTKDNMIMKCSIDGSNNLPLTPGFVANISNDGTKIAFMNQYNIYTMNIDGSNITKLTDYDKLSNVSIYNFSWSQDDRSILFDYVTPSGDMHYISKIENNFVTNIYSTILDSNFFTNDIKWSIKNKKDKKRGVFNNLAW